MVTKSKIFTFLILFLGLIPLYAAESPVSLLLISRTENPKLAQAFQGPDWDVTVQTPEQATEAPSDWKHYAVTLLCEDTPEIIAGYEKEWKNYLENGGILFVSSYNDQMLKVVSSILPGTSVAPEYCSINADKTAARSNLPADHEILVFPSHVTDHFSHRPGGWIQNHLQADGSWEVIIRCPDGAPMLIGHPAGSGYLAVTAFVELARSAQRQENTSDLIQNILMHNQLRESGISVKKLFWPEEFADHSIGIHFLNTSQESRRIAGEITFTPPNGKSQSMPFDHETAPGEELELSWESLPVHSGSQQLEINLNSPVHLHAKLSRRISPAAWVSPATPRIYPSMKKTVPFRLQIAPALKKPGSPYRFECYIDQQKYEEFRASGPESIELDLSHLSAGLHQVRVRILQSAPRDGNTRSETVLYEAVSGDFTILDEEPLAMVDREGFITYQGKRIFPYGFYTVSWRETQPRDELLDFSIEHGLNLMHVSYNDRLDDFRKFAEKAREHNILIILEGVGGNQVRQLRHIDNILAWNTMDEPDLAGRSLESLMPLRRELMQEDPDRPEYTVIVSPEAFKMYRPIADIIACDYYPFHFPGAIHTCGEVFERLSSDLAGGPQAPFAVLWCYGYAPGDLPSPAQLRSQFYQVIAGGAKGILLYTWNDGYPFSIKPYSAVTSEAVKLGDELKHIEAFLLHGKRTRLEAVQPLSGRYAVRWDLNGEVLLIVINADPNSNAEFHLNGTFPEMEQMFSENPLRIEAGQEIHLQLEGQQVLVFKSL